MPDRAVRLPSTAEVFAPGPNSIGHCDDGHVCEEHPDMPWPHTACDAAGMPCSDPDCREPRADGLTPAEGVVMDALVAAVIAMRELPSDHPAEMDAFARGIHECQATLALRIVRRAHPYAWPRHA